MLKIIFAGTPQLSCPSLEALWRLEQQKIIQISAVLTQPDRPTGRKRIVQPGPVKQKALELGCAPILSPERLDLPLREQIRELRPDLLVVFAYGKIFRQKFLDIFPLGGINLHPSALPEWRGPSPIEAQLLSGAQKLGISVQRLALEMDAGDLLEQQSFPLPKGADYFAAAEIAAHQGAALLQTACQRIASEGMAYLETARPQNHEVASYCQKIRKEDGRIDWQRSAAQISRQCATYAAWPHTYSFYTERTPNRELQQIHILAAQEWQEWKNSMPESQKAQQKTQNRFAEHQQKAQPGQILALHPAGLLVRCGQGSILAMQKIQRQNRKPVTAKDFTNQLQNIGYFVPKWEDFCTGSQQFTAPPAPFFRFQNAQNASGTPNNL